MDVKPWLDFMATLREEKKGPFFASTQDFEKFAAFVKEIPTGKRIPLLLHAYDRYRELSVGAGDSFDISCWSILISTVLNSGITPDEAEAVSILKGSYHRCGHGNDVEPPLSLAEKAFHNRPYSRDLFDAAATYRKTLKVSRGSHAANVKQKLSWVLWHDPRRIEKRCLTRQIQVDIHAMPPEEGFAWQWLFRNTQSSTHTAASNRWLIEARRRLRTVGEESYLNRIEQWLTLPSGEIPLSPAGSCMLRLLVWHGAIVDTQRSLPLLVTLARANWKRNVPVGKVVGALAWLIRTEGKGKFMDEVTILCQKWSGDSAEIRRMQSEWFPEEAEQRAATEALLAKQQREEHASEMREIYDLLQAKAPKLFSPGSVLDVFSKMHGPKPD